MMAFLEHDYYREDVDYLVNLPLDWERLAGSRFLISGASGNIAGLLVDVLMKKDLGIHVTALGRNEKRAKERFASHWEDGRFRFIAGDINEGVSLPEGKQVDYVFHAASNTHPRDYANDPIGTIATNVIGASHMLEAATSHGCKRFVYASSVEIYGENRGDVDKFKEDYLGYIDCNTMRAGYPESKRVGEALCQAYRAARGLDVVIARFARTYGPTLLPTDTKAISQFISKGVKGEDVVLKSKGDQLYSYSYVADAVAAFLYILLLGEPGEAYNVADAASDLTLRELAEIVARYGGKEVVYELPDAKEAAGYSTATKALLDATKLSGLGWKAHYDMESGLIRTMDALKGVRR